MREGKPILQATVSTQVSSSTGTGIDAPKGPKCRKLLTGMLAGLCNAGADPCFMGNRGHLRLTPCITASTMISGPRPCKLARIHSSYLQLAKNNISRKFVVT